MKPISIKRARKTIRKAFINDPDFKNSYVANVAVFLYQNFDDPRLRKGGVRNDMANRLIDLIFSK